MSKRAQEKTSDGMFFVALFLSRSLTCRACQPDFDFTPASYENFVFSDTPFQLSDAYPIG